MARKLPIGIQSFEGLRRDGDVVTTAELSISSKVVEISSSAGGAGAVWLASRVLWGPRGFFGWNREF